MFTRREARVRQRAGDVHPEHLEPLGLAVQPRDALDIGQRLPAPQAERGRELGLLGRGSCLPGQPHELPDPRHVGAVPHIKHVPGRLCPDRRLVAEHGG